MRQVAGLAPRATANQQSPKAHAEAACAAVVLQRHEVVLGELPHAVHIKANVRHGKDYDDGKQQAEEAGAHEEIEAVIDGGNEAGCSAGAGVRGRAMHEEIGVVDEAAEGKEVEPEAAGEDEVEKFSVILGAEFGVVRH